MRALSIRQPFVEEILRGIKTVEYRSRSTSVIGERFAMYAAKTPPTRAQLCRASVRFIHAYERGTMPFPIGVIVGSAVITRIEQLDDGTWAWHLGGVRRLVRPRQPRGMPQPGWFQA